MSTLQLHLYPWMWVVVIWGVYVYVDLENMQVQICFSNFCMCKIKHILETIQACNFQGLSEKSTYWFWTFILITWWFNVWLCLISVLLFILFYLLKQQEITCSALKVDYLAENLHFTFMNFKPEHCKKKMTQSVKPSVVDLTLYHAVTVKFCLELISEFLIEWY